MILKDFHLSPSFQKKTNIFFQLPLPTPSLTKYVYQITKKEI